MKILILQLMVIAFCLSGCAATHYHERQSERVTFYLRAPGAEKVEFVSSLDEYNPHRASRLTGSRWAVTVATSSEFRYFYIVDGESTCRNASYTKKMILAPVIVYMCRESD